MTLRVAIADDEPLSIDILKILLSEISPEVGPIEIVATCSSGKEALQSVQTDKPDLLFLDINMPDGDGISVAEALKKNSEIRTQIIFTTAHAEFAVHAFDMEVADYLLKPVQSNRLLRALQRVKSPEASDDSPSGNKSIAVPVRGGIELVQVSQIEWAVASADYVHIHLGNRDFLVRTTLSALAADVSPILTQTHRSYIANLNAVEKVTPRPKGEALLHLRSGAEIPVSRTYKCVLDQILSR